jgi:hypothetical protein
VNDSFRTHVTTGQAQVHAGIGDMNVTNLVTQLLGDDKGRTPRAVADDQLLWLKRRFVYPSGFDRARRALAEHRTVLLHGAPGSGRTAAGRMLLYELAAARRTFQELLPDENENGNNRVELSDIGEGSRLLLDLSASDQRLWALVEAELPTVRKTVQDCGAHLVVVLPQHGLQTLPPDLVPYRGEIHRPSGLRLLRRYLRLDGMPEAGTAEPPPDLAHFLAGDPSAREVADFAELVGRARERSPGASGFAGWCTTAYHVLTDHGKPVSDAVGGLANGPERALLLTTAMLHEAQGDTLHRACVELLRTVQHPRSDQPLLERDDLVQRFKAIKAKQHRDGRVFFRPLRYDAAVRAHFWDHRPDLRELLRDWVEGMVETLPSPDADRLVTRFAEQCLRTGDIEKVLGLVTGWTRAPSNDRRLRAAAHALEHGLEPGPYAAEVRRRTWHWAREPGLSEGLAKVLVGVCAEVMALRHPDQAMVRLHHLARGRHHADEAREALLRLVRPDRRLYRRLLDRLTGADRESAHAADLGLFLELADPAQLVDSADRTQPLLAETTVGRQLVHGWGLVFHRCPATVWNERVRQWLTVAADGGRMGDLLLGVLVDAGERHADVLSGLYVAARSWESATENPARRPCAKAVVERLLRKIDTAQGLDEAEPAR